MARKSKNTSEFSEKVMKGLKIVSQRLIQSKIEKNQSLVIMRDGKVITIKATDLSL
ncbi:hypothetical protein L1S35_00945 [Flavobacterium sp. AS60]|uniref:hypothetical protein n=1 Tax=Flavobacterium anseongense TaxID=2910677 RepID=UPI001F467F27|nr:hypothetical protein [Flavobacterium sp. AS60]MCF6128221.1 hypothetical protein [Flavobacterium sp. AS60]